MATAQTLDALSIEVLVNTGQLKIRYILCNTSDSEICVFDKHYRTASSGQRLLDEHKAYVLFEEPDTLHVTRSTIPIPDGLKVEYPEVPYFTLLKPGEITEGEVLLPIPVYEATPYLKVLNPRIEEECLCRQVYFSIGVMSSATDLILREARNAPANVYRVDYEQAMRYQSIIKSPIIKQELPTIVYRHAARCGGARL